ncbi:hypothetical protein CFC21_000784 [Triticum aestivum]|uniref:Uncharacterized protein n=1 Tax=Triticum aestivum TaxID=4565 RepID=A0A3B5XV83_WHEAT|nr:uncharacterized protein LOC123189491 [Triticum aestivum]KAF6982388.1 hypothetical protein CFC21_000784 [Triticum aestivum]
MHRLVFGLHLLLARTARTPSNGEISLSHTMMNWLRSMKVVMLKAGLVVVWTTTQAGQNNVVNYVDEEPNAYRSPSPTLQGAGEFGFHFSVEEETENLNVDAGQHSSTPMQEMKTTPSSTQARTEKPSKKKQKRSTAEPPDGFHEIYLKLKQEEIDRFAAIEEKKAAIEEKKTEDPYSINKCITTVEELEGLQLSDILMASDIFQAKNNRKVFLSFSTNER